MGIDTISVFVIDVAIDIEIVDDHRELKMGEMTTFDIIVSGEFLWIDQYIFQCSR